MQNVNMGKRSYIGSVLSAQFFYKPDTKKYMCVCVWILSQVYLLQIKIKLNNIFIIMTIIGMAH